ncbi:MAG: sugar ABC transporter permease [Candidatus Bipolaricaulis anaerobius]|nr:sugar ABC transporter permease [Candidatus Bipolaricaulis anaerobius]
MEARFPGYRLLPYVLILPSIAVIIVFLVVPFAMAVQQSFYRTSPFGTTTLFVGLDNYAQLFSAPEYVQSLLTTLAFAALVIGGGLALSLAIAILVTRKIRGVGFYQVAFIWTYALSPAVAGIIWALLFDPSVGLGTYLIQQLTGYRVNMRVSGTPALLIASAAAVWNMLGYNICFYIAGLQNVPKEFEEAARVDGASPWRTFWRITFPMLSPTTAFLLFTNTIYAFFQVFGLIDILTQGGPGGATEILVYKLYRDGFIRLRVNYAAAQSVLLFLMVAAMALFQLRVTTRRAEYSR